MRDFSRLDTNVALVTLIEIKKDKQLIGKAKPFTT